MSERRHARASPRCNGRTSAYTGSWPHQHRMILDFEVGTFCNEDRTPYGKSMLFLSLLDPSFLNHRITFRLSAAMFFRMKHPIRK